MKKVFSFVSPEWSAGTPLKQKLFDLFVEKTVKKEQAGKKIKAKLEEIKNMDSSFKKARNLGWVPVAGEWQKGPVV